MQNPLLQQIDAIAKEKGVEPEIIIGAVQDAIEAAARKRYKNETLRAKFNTETGQIELCAVKRIVEEVTDPPNQISLAEAQQLYGDEAEVDMEIEFPRPTEDLGPHRRADRQAGDLPEGPRGRARQRLRRVQQPGRRSA